MNERENANLAGGRDQAALFGGRELDVTYLDGRLETVRVRALPIKAFPQLQACLLDEGKQAELYCDRPAGWGETLSPAGHEAVILAGEEINRDFFSRWVERQKGRAGWQVRPDAAELGAIIEAVGRSNPALLARVLDGGAGSPGGSPKSARRKTKIYDETNERKHSPQLAPADRAGGARGWNAGGGPRAELAGCAAPVQPHHVAVQGPGE